MVCPVTEEAKIEAAAPRETAVVSPLTHETPPMEFVEEPPTVEAPAPPVEPASEAKAEEPPTAEAPAPPDVVESPPPAEVAADAAPETPTETYEVEPLAPVVAEGAAAPETPTETYEVEPPLPVAPVTQRMDFAVDEETAEVTPGEAACAPAAEERPAEVVPALPADEPSAAALPEVEAPPVEEAESPQPAEEVPEPAEALETVSEASEALFHPVEAEKPAEKAPEAALEAPFVAARAPSATGTPDLVEDTQAELTTPTAKEFLPPAVPEDTISTHRPTEFRESVPVPPGPVEVPQEEAKPVTDETRKPKPDEQPKKPKPDEIEVFDIEQPGTKEEEFEILEEEPAEAAPAAPAAAVSDKEKSLEEEMAELFGDEQKEASPDLAFAQPQPPKVEEDFDLSVFQKDKQEAAPEEPVLIPEETLFEVEQPTVEPDAAVIGADLQGVSRIRAMTEERTPASVYLYTAAILIAFGVVAFAGMVVTLIFLRRS